MTGPEPPSLPRVHEDPDRFREAVRFTASETRFLPRLIEKDYFCTLLLGYLSAADGSLVFKGGTCLAEDILQKSCEDRPGKENSRIAIGQTRGGRYLRVIYVPDPDPDSVFVITAYELAGKPLKAYRRRGRRRQRR